MLVSFLSLVLQKQGSFLQVLVEITRLVGCNKSGVSFFKSNTFNPAAHRERGAWGSPQPTAASTLGLVLYPVCIQVRIVGMGELAEIWGVGGGGVE